ncbi:hypothetical protein KIN20_035545 [Parelaphostrongylus tenuis]|uniref:Transmembrane protein 144 n=1 Tax=Parelaphostrongylus tenuis TaxID=148309 RepID=A0AAD5RBK6_PARTN|nr:hypothetical protein KIN20_035545 [Parelaphostrongylus tenuis]
MEMDISHREDATKATGCNEHMAMRIEKHLVINLAVQMSITIGLCACAVSAVFFGSMFVPIRKYDPKDGMFTQWVTSTAILVIGFIVLCLEDFPDFYPLAMLGGAFWTIGNAAAVPTMSFLGMALGMLIWNISNCLTGWASGRFGLFGMKANPPASSFLNYAGLVCVIAGGILFSRVKSEEGEKADSDGDLDMISVEERQFEYEKMAEESLTHESTKRSKEEGNSQEDVKVVQSGKGRPLGFSLALCSGIFYGITFVPVNYMIDNPDKFPNYPKDGLAYVFSHYFGIFLTASAIFIGYALIKKNKPIVPPSIFLPAFATGLLWGVGQASFFIANQHLSQAITFPIITMLPGCVASAWSILYFGEIKGLRNMTFLGIAMLVTLLGAIMVGMSKFVNL